MGVSCLALLLHRTHPRITVAVNAVCATIVIAQGYLLTPLLLGPVMAALYWLATATERPTIRVYGFSTMGVLTVAAAVADSMDHVSLILRTIGPVFWLMLPLAISTMTRLRRAYLEATQARAEHAERTREEEARLRVTEERMRIARELHDVVAHHLALANAQWHRRTPRAEQPPADQTDPARPHRHDLLRTARTQGHTGPVAADRRRRFRPAGTGPRTRPAARTGLLVRLRGDHRHGHHGGGAAAPVPGRRPDRLPDRAGGAHQRHQARGHAERARPVRLHAAPACSSRSPTRGRTPAPPPSPPRGSASWGCASAPSPWAANCGRGRARRGLRGEHSTAVAAVGERRGDGVRGGVPWVGQGAVPWVGQAPSGVHREVMRPPGPCP